MMFAAAIFACLGQVSELPAPGPMVQDLLRARWLSPQQRSEGARFHGMWTEADLPDTAAKAEIAHWEWNPADASLLDTSAPTLMRARAMVRGGALTDAIVVLDQEAPSARRDALLGEALLLLDRDSDARAHLEAAADSDSKTAAEARAVLRATSLLWRMQDPSTDAARTQQAHLSALASARIDLDPAYWPLLLDEAHLLESRGNRTDAVAALREVIQLNPRAAQAWFDLGRLHLRVFDFDGLDMAVSALRLIRSDHELAVLLEAEAAIVQQRWNEATAMLEALPWLSPRGEALAVAAAALDGRTSQARAIAQQSHRRRPGDATVMAVAGRLLALHRRYLDAERWLRAAIETAPSDHRLWSELGLMWMQAARDEDARVALDRAVALDPFDRRAANSRQLLRTMEHWDSVERGDVLLRWAPGEDELFARAIAPDIARVHDAVEAATGWTPSRPTIVELHPDHEHFAVRVTGLPNVHTIAACTGPLVAMEVPRRGAPGLHGGAFDWREVLTHELAHVAHLDMSKARVPLWLTEGAAVAGEEVPLDFPARLLVARRWQEGTLLDFDDLTWAFVRPRREDDRQLAYAQSGWFVEFLSRRLGPNVIPSIMLSLGEGKTLDEAFIVHAGRDPRMLWTDFIDQQVPADLEAWGLDRTIPAAAASADLPLLRRMVDADPDHVPLRSLLLHRELDLDPDPAPHIDALVRLARARPLDPWPRLHLIDWYESNGEPGRAASLMEEVVRNDGGDPDLRDRLAMLHRAAGDVEASLASMASAVACDPFDVVRRERAAALALEAGQGDLARSHIEALILLEPDEPLHRRRLDAVD